ncbi:hypothetical protein GOBAR_AA18623 [Gossypium barbadense]|uniref:Homeobox domain-containing protein n=1 Tax=Gossypium barbadense TaxID=3634 RepID=A0A2P5XFB4_GOSBA|nr:hypothetical protein GOBAR_AA18623 [Gossypium barbadense]
MELGLSLGGSSKPFSFLEKTPKLSSNDHLGFCMGLGRSQEKRDSLEAERRGNVHETGLSKGRGRGLDVNRLPMVALASEATAGHSSPDRAVSSCQLDFWFRKGNSRGKRDMDAETERGSSRASDDDEDENGSSRKKLQLSKEQSAFLEESFKEHNNLNPKQKLALAKQLNLRPRQVEVWFQNRRATKLKQTELDCEYLKRCCETLTEENRRLHKEVQELRALKTCQPFYMQLPATTLTMCPSCERVTTTSATDAKIGI